MELQTAIGASATHGVSDRDRSLRDHSSVDRSRAVIGQTIKLSMPEMGLEGEARVVAVEPCPANLAGSATGIVTGTFVREAPETLSLYIDALSQPIGVTPSHPFWSLDRRDWVAAGDLAIGETLATLNDDSTVVNVTGNDAAQPVYNIEVCDDHTYFVSTARILVHNNYAQVAKAWVKKYGQRLGFGHRHEFELGEAIGMELSNRGLSAGARVRIDSTGDVYADGEFLGGGWDLIKRNIWRGGN